MPRAESLVSRGSWEGNRLSASLSAFYLPGTRPPGHETFLLMAVPNVTKPGR